MSWWWQWPVTVSENREHSTCLYHVWYLLLPVCVVIEGRIAAGPFLGGENR